MIRRPLNHRSKHSWSWQDLLTHSTTQLKYWKLPRWPFKIEMAPLFGSPSSNAWLFKLAHIWTTIPKLSPSPLSSSYKLYSPMSAICVRGACIWSIHGRANKFIGYWLNILLSAAISNSHWHNSGKSTERTCLINSIPIVGRSYFIGDLWPTLKTK